MTAIWAIATVVLKELYRRKDVYVLFVLTALLTVLAGSISFFDDRNIVRYVKEICLLLIWISGLIISITTAARQIPAERENRTIFPLLAKPVSRAQVVAGKFLGCWLASGAALLVFYLFYAVIMGSREHAWPIATYIQVCSMQWAMLGVVIALTVLGSVVFAAPSSNSTITAVVVLGILFLGRYLHRVAIDLPAPIGPIVSILYFALPHLEFFDLRDFLVHDWGTISWKPWLLAGVYALAYSSFFLTAAWLVFRHKPLNQHR